ncbi:solute carrier family 23 protein, partial [Lactococcus lactis]
TKPMLADKIVPAISPIKIAIERINPVLGGAMLIMFGMVATQGIRMLAKVEFEGNQNLLIAAVAIAMGVGFNSTNLFTALPSFIQPFVSNGIVMSTVSAIILNLVFNHGKKDELVTDETK